VAAIDGRYCTEPMLIGGRPAWAPAGMLDLVIRSRLGPIVSISRSNRTIKSLLKDSIVIAFKKAVPPARSNACGPSRL
jgi:hypothetical protein